MRNFLLALLVVIPGLVFSQSKNKISGTVSDSTKPVALATVRLFKANAPTVLQTAISKDNGNFELNKPAAGDYILSFTHTGFAEKRINITVDAQASDMQIDQVQLSKEAAVLTGVTVKAQRPMIEQSDDKVVFNVEDDPAAKSETAIDILRKTPFISVDGEDNVKVNGKSNFKILLNGRETSMFARNIKEALRGFPGTLISKIEVITAPSAKYDAEGIGGLINIITKKKVAGYNGSLGTFSRTSDKLNSFFINGNAKIGKFGITGFFDKGFTSPLSLFNSSTTVPAVATAFSKRALAGNQRGSSDWAFGNIEMSYELDSLNTISLYTNIDGWGSKSTTDQTITTDFVSSPSTVSYYNLYNNSDNPGISVGSDYIRHFAKKKDRELSLRFLGEFGKNDSRLNSFQDNPGTDRYLNNNSHAVNNQYTIQLDNIIPLKKAGTRIEGGVKAILRRASSDFESLVKYDEASSYKMNLDNTDHFKYDQDVVSLYGMYNFRTKKSSFRIGTRVEYTSVNGNFITSKTQVKSDYATWLPNLQFTNRINSEYTMVFGYNKRLQRPYIYDLNPFVNNNDSLNISFGNPDLGPQTIHVLSSQLRYSKNNTFAGINLDASYSDNKILQYSFFDPATGITKTTSLNIGKEFQTSMNLNLSFKLTQKWNLSVNGSLRYISVTNNSDKTQSNNGFGTNIGMNTSYRFTDKFSISSFLGFWRDPQTIQTTYPFWSWHNVAVNYKIFKNKLNISVRTVNYYEKTRDFKTIIKDKNFYTTNINRQIRRGAVLSLNWNFGKLNENVSKKKGVTNDDILTRPAAPSGN